MIRPYRAFGRRQLRIGVRVVDGGYRDRFYWVGLTWQLPRRRR